MLDFVEKKKIFKIFAKKNLPQMADLIITDMLHLFNVVYHFSFDFQFGAIRIAPKSSDIFVRSEFRNNISVSGPEQKLSFCNQLASLVIFQKFNRLLSWKANACFAKSDDILCVSVCDCIFFCHFFLFLSFCWLLCI